MFKKRAFQVYRQTTAPGGFSDPVWEHTHTVSLGYEEMSYTDSIEANQNSSDIKAVAYHYGPIPPDVTDKDLIRDSSGVTLKVQSVVSFQNGIIPHYEIYITTSPWQVGG